IASAQRQVASRTCEIRKNVLEYDDVMTEQREKVYSERRRGLDGEDLGPQMEGIRARLVFFYRSWIFINLCYLTSELFSNT
ncbi:Protein translocase subunit SecA, partial [human gut metagenome]